MYFIHSLTLRHRDIIADHQFSRNVEPNDSHFIPHHGLCRLIEKKKIRKNSCAVTVATEVQRF